MPLNYTGNPTATQAPSPAPGPGIAPVVALPADGDTDAAATFAQGFKVLADFVTYVHGFFWGDGSGRDDIHDQQLDSADSRHVLRQPHRQCAAHHCGLSRLCQRARSPINAGGNVSNDGGARSGGSPWCRRLGWHPRSAARTGVMGGNAPIGVTPLRSAGRRRQWCRSGRFKPRRLGHPSDDCNGRSPLALDDAVGPVPLRRSRHHCHCGRRRRWRFERRRRAVRVGGGGGVLVTRERGSIIINGSGYISANGGCRADPRREPTTAARVGEAGGSRLLPTRRYPGQEPQI